MTRSPATSTYDDDFFAWTREQAAALRKIPKAAVGPFIDIEHVAGEIEDLGKRDLREVTSFLARLFEHLIKIDACRGSADVPHWYAETLVFQSSAAASFSASMRQSIDLARIWAQSRKRINVFLDKVGVPPSSRTDCPFTLDELLSDDFDLGLALARLDAAES